MPRFFIQSADLAGGRAVITGEDAQHITKALRMKPGEHVTLCDEAGVEYETVLLLTGERVECEILSAKPSENEPPYRAVVYQALVKGDRFETVLMKATELGAARIVPVASARCTVRLEPKEYAKKRERWQRIAAEAAKQCGRARIPDVTDPMPFAAAVKEAARAELPLFCYEAEGTDPLPVHLAGERTPETVSVVIGPEGGFEEAEADEARALGMKMTGLGRRILRTETAEPAVLACLSCRYEMGRALNT